MTYAAVQQKPKISELSKSDSPVKRRPWGQRRRMAQRVRIRVVQPWLSSTGPRRYAVDDKTRADRKVLKRLKAALRLQSRYVRDVQRGLPRRDGWAVTIELCDAAAEWCMTAP